MGRSILLLGFALFFSPLFAGEVTERASLRKTDGKTGFKSCDSMRNKLAESLDPKNITDRLEGKRVPQSVQEQEDKKGPVLLKLKGFL